MVFKETRIYTIELVIAPLCKKCIVIKYSGRVINLWNLFKTCETYAHDTSDAKNKIKVFYNESEPESFTYGFVQIYCRDIQENIYSSYFSIKLWHFKT